MARDSLSDNQDCALSCALATHCGVAAKIESTMILDAQWTVDRDALPVLLNPAQLQGTGQCDLRYQVRT